MRYKVDPEAYPYSASIFDVEEKTGNVVTRVNLNEEPSLKFSVRNYIFFGGCVGVGVCVLWYTGDLSSSHLAPAVINICTNDPVVDKLTHIQTI